MKKEDILAGDSWIAVAWPLMSALTWWTESTVQRNNPNKRHSFITCHIQVKVFNHLHPPPLFSVQWCCMVSSEWTLWAHIYSPEHCYFILPYIKIKAKCVFLSASVYLQMRGFNLKEWPNSEVVSKTWWLMFCLETCCKWLVFYCIKIRDS